MKMKIVVYLFIFILIFIILVLLFGGFIITKTEEKDDDYFDVPKLISTLTLPPHLLSTSPTTSSTSPTTSPTTSSTSTIKNIFSPSFSLPPPPPPIKNVSNIADLQSVFSANPGKLVVLKAYTQTCSVCQAYAPTYSQFPPQYPTVVFAEYDAGNPSDLSTKLNLQFVPTTVLYIGGNSVAQFVGLQIASIKQAIDTHKTGI